MTRGRHLDVVRHLKSPAHQHLIAGQASMTIKTESALYLACKAVGDFAGALSHLEIHSALERDRLTLRAEKQASVLLARLDLEQAQAATARAQLDARMQQRRVCTGWRGRGNRAGSVRANAPVC